MRRCYGPGAHLMIDHEVVSWYASARTSDDEKYLNIIVRDEKCQQTAECLNLLVALRTWKAFWQTGRLEVRDAHIAASTMVLHLK